MRCQENVKISNKTRDFEEMRKEILHTLQDGGIADISQAYIDFIANEIDKPQSINKKS